MTCSVPAGKVFIFFFLAKILYALGTVHIKIFLDCYSSPVPATLSLNELTGTGLFLWHHNTTLIMSFVAAFVVVNNKTSALLFMARNG